MSEDDSGGAAVGAGPLLPARALPPSQVLLNLEVASADSLYREVARRVSRAKGPSEEQVVERLRRRHAQRSPVLGGGVALPHAAVPVLQSPTVLYLRPVAPIVWHDGAEVRDVVAILVPFPGLAADHVLLDRIRATLTDDDKLSRLRACASVSDVRAFFTEPG